MKKTESGFMFVVQEAVYLKPPVDRLVVTGVVKRGCVCVGDRLLARCVSGNREVVVEAIEIPEGRDVVYPDEYPSLRLAGAPEHSIKPGDKLLGARSAAPARHVDVKGQHAPEARLVQPLQRGRGKLFGPRRACPVCGKIMMKQRMVGGVVIDTCQEHGLWLDNNALPAIVSRARGVGQFEFRNRLRRAKTDGRVQGMLLGMFSLLFD